MNFDAQPTSLYSAAACLAIVCVFYRIWTAGKSGLNSIPVVGHGGFMTSYITAFRFTWDSQRIIDEGYVKYKGGLFRIPTLAYWLVVVTDTVAVEDIRRASDDTLSFSHALWKFLQSDFTVGPQIRHNAYHTELIRGDLTRYLDTLFPDMHDELVLASRQIIPPDKEWTLYSSTDTMAKLVFRTSNRIFVGPPTCRDPDFQTVNIQFTLELVKALVALTAIPGLLKPLGSKLFSNLQTSIRRCSKHIELIIQSRRETQDKLGCEWHDKPIDMLMWCMDKAPKGLEQETPNLARRILLINFGAIHMTSTSLTFALYNIATYPQYVGVLREEIEAVTSEHGWTKIALNHMVKLDSFLKETLRLDSPGIWCMQRFSLADFTFSNGQRVPKGTMVACPVVPMQLDEEYHELAKEFSPWRYSDQSGKSPTSKRQPLTSTSPEYLTFGHGRRACPGRFFASVQLKAILAHLLLTYDVKFPAGSKRPANVYIGSACVPGEAKLMFRKRQV